MALIDQAVSEKKMSINIVNDDNGHRSMGILRARLVSLTAQVS